MEDREFPCAEEAIHILDAAFDHLPVPHPDVTIEPLDIYEIEWIRARFSGKHWQDVEFDPRQWHELLTTQLSPEGFRYYLPSLLRCALKHRSDGLAEHVASNFRLGEGEYRENYMAEKAALLAPLSSEQKRAIIVAVRCIGEFADDEIIEPWPGTEEERVEFEARIQVHFQNMGASKDHPDFEYDRPRLLRAADFLEATMG